jgi:hypothetical protein
MIISSWPMSVVHTWIFGSPQTRDLVNCYKSLHKLKKDCEKLRGQLKELEEAALPIAKLLVPHPGGPKIAPLVDRLKEAPDVWQLMSSIWRSPSRTKSWCT